MPGIPQVGTWPFEIDKVEIVPTEEMMEFSTEALFHTSNRNSVPALLLSLAELVALEPIPGPL